MKFISAVFLLTLSFNAFSKCELMYERVACKGKEKESYAKCDGNKTCTKVESAEDEKECMEAALKACPNSRLDITKDKKVTAKWKGKELLSKSGKADFCLDYDKRAQEFNKCE